MPIAKGTRLGPYEILSPIGAGGMGEVYRARDSRLGRVVAMKFLPERLEKDDVAQKRFLREARSAAALDHPFICKIYEVGGYEGRLFIAMEYVVGTVLSQRLTEGPLSIEETLRVSIQVAEALEAAHKHRIIHRDLKPSNIMLTAEGYVKVVDFGLAKQLTLMGQDDSEGTTVPALTQHGIIIGTVSYMSPEQTCGKDIDERSDIFSFGSVLYEMTTGQCSFPGNGVQEVVISIQINEPPPLSKYVRRIPAELQRIVNKALQKDRKTRYQSISDLRADLKRLAQNLGDQPRLDQKLEETLGPPTVDSSNDIFTRFDSPPDSERKGGKGRFWWLLSSMAGVLLVVGVYLALQRVSPDLPVVVVPDVTGNSADEAVGVLTAERLVPIHQVPETSEMGKGMVIRTNPIGGDRVEANTAITVYVSSGPTLSVVPSVVGVTVARASTQLADANLTIGLQHREAGNLAKGRVIRTNPRAGDRVEPNTAVNLYVSAGTPQQMIAFHSRRGGQHRIYAMDPDGSNQTRLTTKHGLFPAWSPDGGRIAFTSTRDGNAEVYVMKADGSNLKRLTFTAGVDGSPAWSPDGRRITFSSQRDGNFEIYTMNADGGNQTRLTNDPSPQVVPAWSPDASRIAFTHGRVSNFEIHVMNTDGSDHERLISNSDGDPAWSPDGRQIAFTSRRDGDPEIYLMNADGSKQSRLTSMGGPDTSPAWSPDGRRIAFASQRDGNFEIYSMNADGSDQIRLTRNPEVDHYPSWTQILR